MKRQWTRWMAVAVLAAGLFLGSGGAARANNLTITNVTVFGRDNSTSYVQFDIKWENSWRNSNATDAVYFHDAAWVFFKVLPDGSNAWQHVTLEGTGTNPPGYAVGTGTPIEMVVPTDRVGMFVRRSGVGAGTTSVQNVKAVWNFASNNLVKTDKVKVQAFGVEMVYVAEGAFWAGNTNGIINSSFHAQGNDNSPIYISSTNTFTIYWGTGDGNTATVSNTFPNGYNAFYCMKYEITEGQWVDFFNTLTDTQKGTRDITGNHATYSGKNSDGVVNRNTVAWTSGDATTAAPDRACNYLCWADGCAFADWAGLRPMTELEFEKACRGPTAAVTNEYAWGSTNVTAISGLQGTDGSGQEYYTAGNLHVSGNGGPSDGPVRAGIFATATSSRQQAGASYWGIMELSGNLWERPVTIGNADGWNFTGKHGDGKLTTSGTQGDADVSNWPALTSASGAGFRGGDWSYDATYARASDRDYAANVYASRHHIIGWRGVRSAP